MGKDIAIDFTNLDQDYQSYLQNYQVKFIGELEALVDIIKANNPTSKISKDKVTNPDNWTFRHVVPDSGRSSPNITLRVSNRDDDISALGTRETISPNEVGRESLFKYLKARLKEAEKVATDSNKKEIKQLRGFVDLLNLQATSVISEIGAIDYLSKFERHLKEIYIDSNANDDDQILFDQTIHCINQLKDAFKKYSLDFLTNGTLEKHTTKDAGRLRNNVVDLYKEIKGNIDELAKNQCLMNKYVQKVNNEIDSAVGCFEHKSNLSFALPTGGETTKQKARKLTQLGLGIGGITSGVLAVSATALTPIFPPAASGAVIFGAGAVACGLAGTTITICNSAENYLRYKIPPNAGEKITMALLATSVLAGGANAVVGSSLPIVTTVISGTNNAVKTTYGTAIIGKSLYDIPDQKKLKSELKAKGVAQTPPSDKVQDQNPFNSNISNP